MEENKEQPGTLLIALGGVTDIYGQPVGERYGHLCMMEENKEQPGTLLIAVGDVTNVYGQPVGERYGHLPLPKPESDDFSSEAPVSPIYNSAEVFPCL